MLNLLELHLEDSDMVKSTIQDCFQEDMEMLGGLAKFFVNGLHVQMRFNK